MLYWIMDANNMWTARTHAYTYVHTYVCTEKFSIEHTSVNNNP